MRHQSFIEHALFRNYYDTFPKANKSLLIDFEDKFQSPIVRKKNQVPTYCLAKFGNKTNKHNNLRHKDNVITYTGIALDIDNKGEDYLSFNKIKKLLNKRFGDIYFILHTTYNSSPNLNRFRIIIPFNEAILPDNLCLVYEYLKKTLKLDGTIDSSSANISLSFLFPACSEENKKNYQIFINKKACRLFDPSVAIAQTPRPPKPHKQPRKKSPKHTVNYIPTPVNLPQLQLAPKTLRIIKTGDANQHNKDHSKAYFIVLQELINKGLDDNQIANIVLDSEYGISERFLEKGIDWSLQEINRVRSKSKQRGLLSKIPPCYNHQEHMSASGAVDYLSRVLKFCVNKPKGIKGIKAPAGLGKTASLIRAIVKSNLLYVEFYVPNHRLAEECRLRFIEAGLNPDQVQTIKG